MASSVEVEVEVEVEGTEGACAASASILSARLRDRGFDGPAKAGEALIVCTTKASEKCANRQRLTYGRCSRGLVWLEMVRVDVDVL